jgi:EpsI family protein
MVVSAAILVLASQTVLSRYVARQPFLPSPPPLSAFSLSTAGWREISEQPVPSESLDALGPDDYVARVYQSARGTYGEVFVAYYKTQLRSKNAHDPQICLPGAGWIPISSRIIALKGGPHENLAVNYYRVEKNSAQLVVLYWFQTFNGAYALEQQLRMHRVWDAMLENRTDMALVRVIVPVLSNAADAESAASELAPIVYNQMRGYFPPNRTNIR